MPTMTMTIPDYLNEISVEFDADVEKETYDYPGSIEIDIHEIVDCDTLEEIKPKLNEDQHNYIINYICDNYDEDDF